MNKLADISTFESLGKSPNQTSVYNLFGRRGQDPRNPRTPNNQQDLTAFQVQGLKNLKNALLEFGKYVGQDKEAIKAIVIGILDGKLDLGDNIKFR